MDPLIDSPYRLHGSPSIFAPDFMDPLIHYMHPLIDSIDFLYRCHGSPYRFVAPLIEWLIDIMDPPYSFDGFPSRFPL